MQKVFAMRGRYNEDGSTSQQVEFRKDDVTSTLTGVQKDNLLLERTDININCFTEQRTEEAKQQRRENREKYGKDYSSRRGKIAVLRNDEVANCLITLPSIEQTILVSTGVKGMQTVTVNDLFCGAGGMGLGFKQAGFEIAGAWDFDKYAVQSYAHNVGDHVKQLSILDMTHEDMPKTDVWTFGFPCQDLSVAGKHAGLFEGKRSGLFFEVMRLLDEITENNADKMPKIIMAENVKGLKPYLGVLESEYKKRGYKMYYTLYNSKYWGVPQNRERYFVVGVHESIDKEFSFPVQQTDVIPKLKTALEPNVEEKYYIADEKAKKIIEQAKVKLQIANGNVEQLQKASGLLTMNEPGRTLRVGGKGSLSFKHNYEHLTTNELRVRKLTPREYARLQGFPDSFEIVVSDSQAYKQFGNAVTVNVAQAIAERIKMFLLSL